MKLGIFTKPIHVEKIVNYMNQHTDLDYVISTERKEAEILNFDIGISYCWPYVIKDRRTWYNFHPAPLPKYKGLYCYSHQIADKIKESGVTLHIVTEELDSGEILMIKKYPLDSNPVHSNELGCIAHYYLFQMFKDTIGVLAEEPKSLQEFNESYISYWRGEL